MRNLPMAIIHVLRQFEAVFSERVWDYAKVLLVGAILAPGTRTVTAALRVLGLSADRQFQNYHRVLNRGTWSSRALSRILLHLLVQAFAPANTPLVARSCRPSLEASLQRARVATLKVVRAVPEAVYFVSGSCPRWPMSWTRFRSCMVILRSLPVSNRKAAMLSARASRQNWG